MTSNENRDKPATPHLELYDAKTSQFYAAYTDESHKSDFNLALRDLVPLIERFQVTCPTGVADMRMLEHGCGTGRPTRHLKKHGRVKHIIGCDISEQMLAHARHFDPDGTYVQLDDERLTLFNAGQFDVIVSCMVVLAIHSKTILQSVFDEVARTLKPAGLFVVINTAKDMYSSEREWRYTHAGHFAENAHIRSGSRTRNQVRGTDFVFNEYYWSDEDMLELAARTRLELIYIHRPLGRDSDGVDWRDEYHHSPFRIYVIRKPLV